MTILWINSARKYDNCIASQQHMTPKYEDRTDGGASTDVGEEMGKSEAINMIQDCLA
jgi:hypothetical protein